MSRRIGARALSAAARAYLRLDGAAGRARVAAHGLATGFFSTALTAEEQGALSIAIYQRAAGATRERALASWEAAWLARRLPAAPARVLVGAAGEGPEVRHLVAAGYRVDALEPAAAASEQVRAIAGVGEVWTARYEELSAAVLDGAANPASAARGRRYDAVLLGWGSLSHVLEARERQRLLEALAQLAPSGPILVSYLVTARAPGRAVRLGGALGRLCAAPRPRRRGGGHAARGARAVGGGVGVGAQLYARERAHVADVAGRSFESDDDGALYPHATLTPRRANLKR